MSTCPVIMLNHLQQGSSPPPSPRKLRRHVIPPLAITNSPPTSPICNNALRAMVQMNLPSIATVSTPPSSPISKTKAMSSPPSSPIIKSMMQLNLSTTASSTAAVPTLCPVKRVQPMARPMIGKSGKRKLGPGCGLLDWIRLCRSKKDLTGTGGVKRPVTLEELAEHNTEADAWTAIRGKVYNLTYYMKFHPGGKEELMKGAGIDCTILFDEAHTGVNVESTLKACYIGTLAASSPLTQRRKNSTIMRNAAKLRTDATLAVPKTIMIGKNNQAVPTAIRKTSMELRNESQAANACEEPDGLRQISPESPIRPVIGDITSRKFSSTAGEAAEGSSMRLKLPHHRIRRTSEPHPRFDWVQSEKSITIHVVIHQNIVVKTSDVILDVAGKSFEAAIFMNDWVFELNIALAHAIVASNVNISCGRVEISLKKEDPRLQWDSIGSFRNGHALLSSKSKRGVKYHTTRVENIKNVNHDTKLYTLRLPMGSYLSVPTGHHLSIRASIDGKDVERSYTPVSSLEANPHNNALQQDGETIELMIKLYKDGKMSHFLSNLKQGDEVIVSDPEGSFDSSTKLSQASDILLIAAGSGFTPMVKILRDYLASELVSRQRYVSASEATGEASEENQQALELPPATTTTPCVDGMIVPSKFPKSAKLLFANKKEKDIMHRAELDHLEQATANRFSVTHILSSVESGRNTWQGLKGRVGKTLIKASLPSVDPQKLQNTLVCICGPEPFMNGISNILLDMDFPDECIQCFQ